MELQRFNRYFRFRAGYEKDFRRGIRFLKTLPAMKRPRSDVSALPPPPSTPLPIFKPRKTTSSVVSTKPKCLFKSTTTIPVTPIWRPLNLNQSELYLPLTFPTGQTFRWRQTAPLQFTGAIGPHLVSLKHSQNGDVLYCVHQTPCESDAKLALLDLLNIDVCLTEIWSSFSAADDRFAELATHLRGARVLRQDPLECLLQFLCSSNNNIARITKMVDYLSSLGTNLGVVEGFEFHEFPSLERLSMVTEQELRNAGFGYRAKYITGTINALQSKPGGGLKWLKCLRNMDLQEVTNTLSTLPGVGPKVAACIALFALDQHHAIPVDTHVWQIATRYLIPELAGSRMTAKLHGRVAEAFVRKYGSYAGWAQTLLFIAELPSQKAILPSHCCNT